MSNEKGEHSQGVNVAKETQSEESMSVDEDNEHSAKVRSQIQSIKAERSQEKSSVTRLITRLTKLINDRGGRTQIRDIIQKIERQVKNADTCNRKLYELVSSTEHEAVEKWYIEVAEKAFDAPTKALAHLEESEDEPPSIGGSIPPRTRSALSSTSNKSAQASEARRKAHIAKLKVKQIEEEAHRRRQLELVGEERRKEIEQATREQERAAKEETGRRRIQEAKDVAAQAELEASLIEVESDEVDPENLEARLRDFDDEPQQSIKAAGQTRHGMITEFLRETQNENILPTTNEANDKLRYHTASWIKNLPTATEHASPTNLPYSPQPYLHHKSVFKVDGLDGNVLCHYPPFRNDTI